MNRPLVIIDDPVTIIEPDRVLLEWVEIVERQGFRVRSRRGKVSDPVYNHDQEGTTWARGHHLPDSEVVIALRAATSLVPQSGKTSGIVPISPADLFGDLDDLDEPIKSFKEAMEEAHKNQPSWWSQIFRARRRV